MIKNWGPIHPTVQGLLHGGDYNPDQWLAYPEVINEDFRLMKLAGANAFSVNIFGWSAIEPEEGVYRFEWLDDIMDRIAEQGGHVILATPSGARPAWMSANYPEVLRVEANRVRNLHGLRHNHCFTSPVYRSKTQEMNRLLAERYGKHPALVLWHISNEYGGECHCELCQDAFRGWLQKKYGSLEQLNEAWWTGFWSHRYSDWSQVESPAPHGENAVHGMNLDWKRFVTAQTIDFYQHEIVPIRELTPDIPVTTNFMGDYPHMRPFRGLNYEEFAKVVDVICWDAYPAWHNDWQTTADLAKDVAFVHDLYRSLKDGKPFLIMECTPSLVNWHQVNKAKRPGMHKLSTVQALAHGSDSLLYFQWRKGKGASEKFHGAVVDHVGHEHTRVFRDVAEVGGMLGKLPEIVGTTVDAKVAILYDWETDWALLDAQGLARNSKLYAETCQEHYRFFWEQGIAVDIITPDKALDGYKLVIAPMLYMVRSDFGPRVEAFVEAGGSFVATYATGMVNENDLTYLEGFPGPLKQVLGIWAEEIDSLYPGEARELVNVDGSRYQVKDYWESVHASTAEVLARFASDLFAGQAAVTRNAYGAGKAYYLASRNEPGFHNRFYAAIAEDLQLVSVAPFATPAGVSVQARTDGEQEFLFLMNFTEETQRVRLGEGIRFADMLTDEVYGGRLDLAPYAAYVLKPVK